MIKYCKNCYYNFIFSKSRKLRKFNRRCVMPMPARAPGSHGDVEFHYSLFSFQEKKNRIIEWLLERHSHIQIYDNIYLLSPPLSR